MIRIPSLADSEGSALGTEHLGALDSLATLLICDTSGKIKYANDSFLQITGFSLPELQEKGMTCFNSGHHPKSFWDEMWKNILAGNFWNGQIKNRNSSGQFFWVQQTILPILGETGNVEELFCLWHEITQQKELEEKQAKSATWYNAILEGTTYAVISAGKDGIINTFNQAAEKLLGYSAAEMIGKQTPAVFHDPDEVVARSAVLSSAIGRSIEPGYDTFVVKAATMGPDTNEWTYITKDGRRVPVRLTVAALRNEAKEVVGFVGFAEDLTEQKKLVQILDQQRAQMITSAKLSSLGEMASGIAHEINNPLAIIAGKIGLLKAKVRDGRATPEILLQDFEKIEATCSRIAKIIQGLRTFSRNAESDPMLPTDLGPVLNDTFELCRERFTKGGVELETNLEPNLQVKCRPAQIAQVLMNLLNNAFDAVSELQERWVAVSAVQSGHEIMIRVTDSGNGIPPAVVKRIMEPFFTTKQVGKGTGLGLSISKGIMESHNGSLSYDASAANTTFIMTIPTSQPEALPGKKAA
jgi:two-component system, LuxR family, sensor histidine kinase DctS